jgi:hypothetical protein
MTSNNDNSGTSTYGWSGSTLGAASGGPRVPIEPIPFNPGRPKTGIEFWRANPRGGIVTATKEISINEINKNNKKDNTEQIGLLLLTNIGGRELTKLSRHDEINGINQEYSPIANLADISLQYNPLAISPNADNVSSFLSTFSLDISKYIPTQQELGEYYPLEADIDKRKIVLFDKETNSLIVHVKNIFTNEKIEVEFMVPRK